MIFKEISEKIIALKNADFTLRKQLIDSGELGAGVPPRNGKTTS